MPSFSDLRNAYKLQKEAKRVKKELKNIHVEAEAQGVKVVVTAEQEVVSITIAPGVSMDALPGLLIDALNRALKKAQVVSAERMQGIMKEMGVTGAEGL
ncbi:YbaB/EbfC family nucleoid-associated protein [Candidatus Peregrinibacteria bacterium]|nr:YbaB/EbfC family nucleoid-associated protein [Candidatus Peregrinibacteria bacterium]